MKLFKYRYLEDFYDEATGESLGKDEEGNVISPKEIETRHFGKRMLHRIVRIEYKKIKEYGQEFLLPKPGEQGGWIERYENLTQGGKCWVGGNAIVCGNAMVAKDAQIKDRAEIGGNAIVTDNAKVRELACVGGNAYVFGNADVSGLDRMAVDAKARVAGKVTDSAVVAGAASTYRGSSVTKNALVGGRAVIYGKVSGSSMVSSYANVSGMVDRESVVSGDAMVLSSGKVDRGSVVESGFVDGLVDGGSIYGSRMLESYLRDTIGALSEDTKQKKFTTEDLRKFYAGAVDNYKETFRKLVEMTWDSETGEMESPEGPPDVSKMPEVFGLKGLDELGKLTYSERKDRYDGYRVRERWLNKKLLYEDYEQLADRYHLKPDDEGYVILPCWFDRYGKVQPVDYDMMRLRYYIWNSRYHRIGGGPAPIMDSGKTDESVIVAGNVMFNTTIKGQNYVTGVLQNDGDIQGEYNCVYGCTKFHGKFRGKAAAVWGGLIYGTIKGNDFPSIPELGFAESQICDSILGESGVLLGKFQIFNSLIDGIVSGSKEQKDHSGKQYLGISSTNPTYLLQGEQAVLFHPMMVESLDKDKERDEKTGKQEAKRSEGMEDSYPNSVNDRYENFPYRYIDWEKYIGYLYTWDMWVDFDEAVEKSVEENNKSIDKQQAIERAVKGLYGQALAAITTKDFKPTELDLREYIYKHLIPMVSTRPKK